MQDLGIPDLAPSETRVGLFGGAFDPVHVAHLWLAQEAVRHARLDRLLFIPCRVPPHKPFCSASGSDRLAMLHRALGKARYFNVCGLELSQSGPSYSVTTLRLMREIWGSERWIGFLLGSDALAEIHTWREAKEFVNLCDALMVAVRPGRPLSCSLKSAEEKVFPLPEVPFCIASTWIRQRTSEELSIKYLVPESVERYIWEKQLYREGVGTEHGIQ